MNDVYDTTNVVNVYHAIDVLNKSLVKDKIAISSLFNLIVPCKSALVDSPVECLMVGNTYCTTALGILNAIFGYTVGDSIYRIFPVYDDNQQIQEFRLGKLNL